MMMIHMRRRLALPGALLLLALLMSALATPVLGGAICSLQATVGGGSATEVEIGEEVLIEGFGFPPGDVEVSFSSDGTFLRSETVTADGAGLFELTVVPQAGEDGLWSVDAAVVEGCTATTGFLVLPGPTPAPTVAPTTVPSAAPTASAGALPNVALPHGGPQPPVVLLGASLLAAAAAAVGLGRRWLRLG